MTSTEIVAWAKDAMERTFNGKKARFENTAGDIAVKAYREGCMHAWKIAQRVCNMTQAEHEEVFPGVDYIAAEFVTECEYDDVAKALDKYDKRMQDENGLHVGDEIIDDDGNVGVVIYLNHDTAEISLLLYNGHVRAFRGWPSVALFKKTGSRYGDLPDIFTAMKAKQEAEHEA